MNGYVKRFNETNSMSFLIKDKQLLIKYKKIWDKVSGIIKKTFDKKLVYDENVSVLK